MSEPVTDSNQLPEGAPDDPLTGHDYDGIQEYDNPLPGWWKWLFVASIVFAPPYMFWYHNGASGRSLTDIYDREYAANLQMQFGGVQLKVDRDTVLTYYLNDDPLLKVGEAAFRSNCISCHRKDGGGLVGPNLCDDSYKNVRDIGDILTVIQKGANAGAMPAWTNRLDDNSIVLVAAYVASMRGTEISNPKPAEGNVIPPWPTELPKSAAAAEEADSESTEPAEATDEAGAQDEPAE